MTEQEQPKNDFMHKLALQIVERRNLVFLIVILGTIFTIFSRSWVKVESDLTTRSKPPATPTASPSPRRCRPAILRASPL